MSSSNHSHNSNSCSTLNSSDLDHMQSIYHTLSSSVYHFVPIFLSFTIFIFAVNFLFVCLTLRKLRQRQIPRKRYYFELNRSIADLVAILVAICGGITIASNPTSSYTVLNVSIVVVANSTFITLWALTNTYISMTILQYFAITKPLWYNFKVTAKNCFIVIIVCWLIALVVGPIPEIIYFQNLCNNACLDYLAGIYVILISGAYITTLFVYLVALTLLCRKNGMHSNASSIRSRCSGMRKLALYIIIYTTAYLPMVILVFVYWQDVGLLFHLLKQSTLCEFETELLAATKIDPNFGTNVGRIACSYFLWNFRALWDPITTIVMEPVLRNWFKCARTNVPQRNILISTLRTLSRNSLFA